MVIVQNVKELHHCTKSLSRGRCSMDTKFSIIPSSGRLSALSFHPAWWQITQAVISGIFCKDIQPIFSIASCTFKHACKKQARSNSFIGCPSRGSILICFLSFSEIFSSGCKFFFELFYFFELPSFP